MWCSNMKQITAVSERRWLVVCHSCHNESFQCGSLSRAVWSILKSLPAFGSLTVVLWLCNWVFSLRSADVRLEEFVYEKLEKKVPTRMNNHELLGQSMIESGNEFGPGTAYGECHGETLTSTGAVVDQRLSLLRERKSAHYLQIK